MKTLRNAAVLCIALAAAGSALQAERIILKNGHELTADVLKSDGTVVVADLGFTVLRLRRSEIARIVKDEAPTSRPGAAGSDLTEPPRPKWQLYRTARMQPTTIEKNAQTLTASICKLSYQ